MSKGGGLRTGGGGGAGKVGVEGWRLEEDHANMGEGAARLRLRRGVDALVLPVR